MDDDTYDRDARKRARMDAVVSPCIRAVCL